jgi:hypothetical protein
MKLNMQYHKAQITVTTLTTSGGRLALSSLDVDGRHHTSSQPGVGNSRFQSFHACTTQALLVRATTAIKAGIQKMPDICAAETAALISGLVTGLGDGA